MKTKPFAIVLIILSTFITASGQFFLKRGADSLEFELIKIVSNYLLIGGLVLYAFGALILIYALKNGELSVLYPIYSTSFVWVILISYFYFGEMINVWKVAGVIFIVGGVSFIGIGSKVGS